MEYGKFARTKEWELDHISPYRKIATQKIKY